MPTPSTPRTRSRSGRGPISAAWFVALVALILGGGALLTVLQREKALAAQREAREAEEDATRPRPFADMRPEVAPPARNPAVDPDQPFGSAGPALSDPAWELAQELAAAGEELYEAAVAAKAAGDVPTLNAKAKAAREKLDEALELTASWEEELIARHGESDERVREILRTRNRWFDRVRWLSKSAGR